MSACLPREPLLAAAIPGLAPRRQPPRRPTAEARLLARIGLVLRALRRKGRRAVVIVDNRCGEGGLLLRAAALARRLGFVAIDAQGFDRAADRLTCARAAAAQAARDPAIGLAFTLRQGAGALPVDEQGADIVLAAPDEDPPAELRRITDPDGAILVRER